jgi:putative FmdB family regulatory protein
MPTYDYECSNCEHLVPDIYQKIDDKPLKKCPSCGKNKLFKVVTGGLHASVKNIKTVGQLADANAKKNKNKLNEIASKKKEETQQEPKPWYHDPKYGENASNKEINKMTKEQKIRYVMEGKK